MIEAGYVIGWVGLAFGIMVPVPQICKFYKTRKINDVSLGTYAFLVLALICYLIHAIYINAPVFIATQAINLTLNSVILFLLIRDKR